MDRVGVLIVSHGSRLAAATAQLPEFVARVASRLPGVPVLPAFFSLARPSVAEQAAALADAGARRIFIFPHFLYAGAHLVEDLPAQLEALGRERPGVEFILLDPLGNAIGVEETVVERLADAIGLEGDRFATGEEIEAKSRERIEARLKLCPLPSGSLAVVRRVVHATADFSFAETLRLHPEAVARGREALAAGRPVICDTRMLAAGITRAGREPLCAIRDPDVAAAATARGITRSAAAMEKLAPDMDGAIVAIGNAPTALRAVIELASTGCARPALIVGLPVGFVDAKESKIALWKSGLCCITNLAHRGGSPAAAAAVNALTERGE